MQLKTTRNKFAHLAKPIVGACVPLLLLSACGGNGAGNEPTTPKPVPPTYPDLTVTFEQSSLNIEEFQGELMTLSITGAQNSVETDIEISGDAEGIRVSDTIGISGGDISVEAGELLNNGSISITVTIKDGANREGTVTGNFSLINTSAAQSIEAYAESMQGVETFIGLAPESMLLTRVTQIAHMAGASAPPPESTFDDVIDTEIKEALIALSGEATDIISQYDTGAVNETIFSTKIEEALSLANSLSVPVVDRLNQAIETTDNIVQSIEFSGVFHEPDTGRLSLFIGNQNLGSFKDGTWVFNDTYGYLTNIVFADQLTCSAE